MLRKAATNEGKDWDKVLPYLLFAYREVPQASTGFSPFELVYGRPVRGPLDVLKESWEASKSSNESVVSYVLTVQEKLGKMAQLAGENLAKAQQQQKRWYDRNARERAFKAGDHVLVLLPTSTNKLLAQWQGPYQVIKQISPVTYAVDMADKKKRRRVLHVNMLRKWNSPTSMSLWTDGGSITENEDELPLWGDANKEKEGPVINSQLSPEQQAELQSLLSNYADVLSNAPGRTDQAQHCIEVTDTKPIRQPPYRLAQAYRDRVKQELEEMQEAGIIEPSNSDWAFPIVLVGKKDGGVRLCVDYRKLNAVSKADAYPMPRVDELIDSLGPAKYITTLDLTRGYWQVPVHTESQQKTAFTTPFGLFQFKVMPFGLQGAPATFQRLMDRVLRGLDDFAAAYIDDVVIRSLSWEQHLGHIQQVLERLRKANLTAKPKKCQFGMTECVYLGHLVGNGKVQPESSKIEAIRTFKTPRD